MRSNISTQKQRQIGSNSERGNGAQMFDALFQSLSLSIERLSCFVWSVLKAIYALRTPAGARANLERLARLVTATFHPPVMGTVDAAGKVPSLGTDQALRSGLIAG